jgi:predicted HTH domain antitoxin
MTYSVVSLRIAPGMLKEINRLAHEEHVKRSTFLCELLDKGLKETKIEHAAEQYKQSKISIGRMVEITRLSRHELFKKLKERGISVHYSKHRLLRKISNL